MTAECVTIQAQLSEYLDHGVGPDAQAAVRAHLAVCVDCRGVLADLERIATTAGGLGPISPPDHIWLEVAGQIHLFDRVSTARPIRIAARSPIWQWAGLAAALVLVTGLVWLGSRPAGGPAGGLQQVASAPVAGPAGTIDALAAKLDEAQESSKRAMAELMANAAGPESPLDPSLPANVQRSMDTIDRAITESRAALEADPTNEPARDSLFDALRRKITVLQSTLSLINQMRQGDQEGAARTAESLGKT